MTEINEGKQMKNLWSTIKHKIWWFFASEEKRFWYSIDVFGTAYSKSEDGKTIDPHKVFK